MWFVSALLTPQYFRGHHHLRRYHFFFLLCLSFTMGVFLSADLYTTFLFFELMSPARTPGWCRRNLLTLWTPAKPTWPLRCWAAL